MKIQVSRRKHILIATLAILMIAVMVGAAGSRRIRKTSSHAQQSNDLTVGNKTQAFVIISAVRDGDFVRLSLRNDYSQAINAFTLSSGPTSGVQVELADGDHEIAPGAIYDYRVAAVSLEPSGSPVKPLKLTILNVVFEDGTGDGDSQATADIKNRRLGERIALSRIIPLLDQALKASDLETPDGTRRLKEKISAACETLEKEQPAEVRGGILHGKGYLLGDIEQAEKRREAGSIDFRGELLRIKERYEKKSAKLGK